MILTLDLWPLAKLMVVLASCRMNGHEDGQDISLSKAAGCAYVVVSSLLKSLVRLVIVLHRRVLLTR